MQNKQILAEQNPQKGQNPIQVYIATFCTADDLRICWESVDTCSWEQSRFSLGFISNPV